MYVLIVWMLMGGSSSIAMHEFHTKESCEAAYTAMGNTLYKHVCAEK